MKGLSTLSSVLLALFLAVACADDDGPTGGNTGGTGGVGGSTSTACEFPYATLTKTTLQAQTSETGACASDTDAICGTNMVSVTGACGVACNSQSTDPLVVASCTKDCVQRDVKPTPSDACTNCYVADVGCSIQNCLAECAGGPTGPCNACRIEKGCTEAFYTCSGLPVPGGQGGSPSSTGGAPATGGVGETATGGTGGAQ